MASKKKSKRSISDIDLNIINHINEYDSLVDLFQLNLMNPDLSKNIIYRVINTIIVNDPIKALEVITTLPFDLSDKSYVALLIKIYSINQMISKAINTYFQIPEGERKKRFIIVIYNELVKVDKTSAFKLLFNEIYNKFVITEEDIQKIYNDDFLEDIFQIMSDNEIIIEDSTFLQSKGRTVDIIQNKCSCCNQELIKFSLGINEVESLKNNLQVEYLSKLQNRTFGMNEIKKLDSYLKKSEFNDFIDGNNILFFRDREVNIDSYRRLEIIYNYLQAYNKPLLFIHQRHRNNIKKLGKYSKEGFDIINRLPIYFTPYNMNDDWFFIWAGISNPKTYVVTNDLLRDHIFKISDENIISNTLSNWINNYVIRYELIDGIYKIRYPKEYSLKVQKIGDIWHIPTTAGWICVS